MRLFIAVFFFFVTSIGYADDIFEDQLFFDFDAFGHPPSGEMICFRGPCLDDNSAIYSKTRTPVASYIKPVDMTQFAGVRISELAYSYYNNGQFQIYFEILCDSEMTESCFDIIEDEFIYSYGMELLGHEVIDSGDGNQLFLRSFAGDGEIFSEIIWKQWQKRAPYVKIYRLDLIEELRSDMNPNYVPVGER